VCGATYEFKALNYKIINLAAFTVLGTF